MTDFGVDPPRSVGGNAMDVEDQLTIVVDFVATVRRETTKDEVNDAFKAAASGALKGILDYSEEPLVSSDLRCDPHSSIIDAQYTKVMDGDFVKMLSWYDNEWGYSSRCVDLLRFIAKKGL